jgi:hypothetical protein
LSFLAVAGFAPTDRGTVTDPDAPILKTQRGGMSYAVSIESLGDLPILVVRVALPNAMAGGKS